MKNSQARWVVAGDSEPSDLESKEQKVSELEKTEELDGKLDKQKEEDKLMHSVLEGDEEAIDEGRLLTDSINYNISSFVPDMMFANMVKDYKMAKKLYGETIIRQLSGYEPGFVEKNIKIPEFRQELKKNMDENVKKMKKKGLLNNQGELTDQGLKLSSLVLYTQELDKLKIKGMGEKKEQKKDVYGDKKEVEPYKKTRYRDIAVKKSVKTALRRGHKELAREDIRIYEREKKGGISIIYGLDASGSMKGHKLGMAKRAGVALSYKAINEKNKVGLIVFGEDVKKALVPTLDFSQILRGMTSIRARAETDISSTINKAVEMFGRSRETKHLILLTDALPTKGRMPAQKTLRAASAARDNDITISVVGINLDKEGKKLALRIAEIGEGRLYRVKDVEELDSVILEDYYSI